MIHNISKIEMISLGNMEMVGGIRGILIHERPILPENNFPFQEERWEGVVLPCL
jgi:hypothetical protein